jgi:glycosyltransferase involved in cell wall biosynthesis
MTAPGISTEPGLRPGKRLTICAIGDAGSVHVAARVRCFAEMGHRVYLVSETVGNEPIEGVTQLTPIRPALRLGEARVRRPGDAGRHAVGRAAEHARRAVAFLRLLRRCRPDIVHVHFAYGYLGWLAGLFGARPLVVSVMGGDVLFEEQGQPTPLGRWLTVNLLRRADFITAKSHHLIRTLDELGGFGGKSERIVWGVAPGRFRPQDPAPLRRRLGLAPHRRVILSPRILRPLYRVHLVVEAMAIVRRHCPDALLLVTEYAGDRDYRAEIARLIDRLGLQGCVAFCGQVRYEDMPAYYSLAEIAVAVPSSDGLPQTLLESMACGTPNILSRLARYEEIVRHGESAYFVEPNPADIAAGIIRLLDEPALRARLAERAWHIVRAEADLTAQAARVERRYQELAGAVRPRALRLGALAAAWRDYRRGGAARRGPGVAAKAHP